VTRYLLDTDHFSLFLGGHPAVVARVLSTPADEMAIGVVTVSELAHGWQAQVSRHNLRGGPALWYAYSRLAQLPVELAAIAILPYAAPEEARFIAWRRAGVRVGTNDLRIAAIAASRRRRGCHPQPWRLRAGPRHRVRRLVRLTLAQLDPARGPTPRPG